MTAFPDTVYGPPTSQTRLQSETADSVAWERYASPAARTEAQDALENGIVVLRVPGVPANDQILNRDRCR